MTKEEAFELGKEAKSILDNPFWKDYPKNPLSEDADCARYFVNGFAAKARKENEQCLK